MIHINTLVSYVKEKADAIKVISGDSSNSPGAFGTVLLISHEEHATIG